jgi:hypothetical protein
MVHATLAPGAQLRLPWRLDYNSLIYTLNGKGSVGDSGQPVHMGQLAVLVDGSTLVITADAHQESRSPTMDVLILGGEPIRESVAWMGPFVMNTKAEVIQAFEDFQRGLLGTVPAEHLSSNNPASAKHNGSEQDSSVDQKSSSTSTPQDISGIHNTPTEIQEK